MTKTEFFELLAGGENSGIEFNTDGVDNRALAKELVAFANLRGGRLLLGVDDDGCVRGLPRCDPPADAGSGESGRRTHWRLEERVMQTCRDNIRPAIYPYFECLRDVLPGRDVAVVRIMHGWSVHHVCHDRHRTYYVRVGSLSRETNQEELARLFQQRGTVRLERRPVSGTSIAALDRRRLTDYFERVRNQAVPAGESTDDWRGQVEKSGSGEVGHRCRALVEGGEREWRAARATEWETLLVNTGFLHEDVPHPPTVAGLMLFGADPSRFLPQASIDAAAYIGTEKDHDVRERRTLCGPVVPLVSASGALLEPGLVDQAMEFVRRNIEIVRPQNGVRREGRWDYPREAAREAIGNAVAHRDYLLSGTDIELPIYSDRLEVVRPGRLPNGITPERMRAGCRSARNELLRDVMRDYGYLEHIGLGVPRKIVRGMRDHNGTEPDLVEGDERFTVRLWKEARARRP